MARSAAGILICPVRRQQAPDAHLLFRRQLVCQSLLGCCCFAQAGLQALPFQLPRQLKLHTKRTQAVLSAHALQQMDSQAQMVVQQSSVSCWMIANLSRAVTARRSHLLQLERVSCFQLCGAGRCPCGPLSLQGIQAPPVLVGHLTPHCQHLSLHLSLRTG